MADEDDEKDKSTETDDDQHITDEEAPDDDSGTDLLQEAEQAEPSPQDIKTQALKDSLSKIQGPSDLDKYKNFIDQYEALQKQRKNVDFATALAAAGAKIGQSIAGRNSGQFNPDLTGIKMVQDLANQPVSDFEQRQKVQGLGIQLKSLQDSNDPNSTQSKIVRNYINSRLSPKGPIIPDTASANDAMLIMKTLGKSQQTKFQKVNGTWTDPESGESKRMSAVFDPASGTYKDPDTGEALPGFLAEGLNPFQMHINPKTGEDEVFNKSRGTAPTPVFTNQPPVSQATGPQEVNAGLNPVTRKELNDKVTPAFNKETEKIQQRLNHVPVILQRLQEAQTNPAALPQLKAELARFDVGDQRLAQQELEMFAKRQGYSGWADWLQAKTAGTISPDFANDMQQAITHVSQNLSDQLNTTAEKHAKTIVNRLPPGQKVDPKLVAPLIYGNYKPSQTEKTIIKKGYNTKTDQTQLIYSDGTKEIVNGRQ